MMKKKRKRKEKEKGGRGKEESEAVKTSPRSNLLSLSLIFPFLPLLSFLLSLCAGAQTHSVGIDSLLDRIGMSCDTQPQRPLPRAYICATSARLASYWADLFPFLISCVLLSCTKRKCKVRTHECQSPRDLAEFSFLFPLSCVVALIRPPSGVPPCSPEICCATRLVRNVLRRLKETDLVEAGAFCFRDRAPPPLPQTPSRILTCSLPPMLEPFWWREAQTGCLVQLCGSRTTNII